MMLALALSTWQMPAWSASGTGNPWRLLIQHGRLLQPMIGARSAYELVDDEAYDVRLLVKTGNCGVMRLQLKALGELSGSHGSWLLVIGFGALL